MKTIFRRIAIYTFIIYILTFLVPGFKINGGLTTLLIGGISLSLMFLILRPILNLISFPINLLTLGFSSILTNAVILYILTYLVKDIALTPFKYPAISYAGFTVPSISFSTILAFIFVAFVISLLEGMLTWLME